MQQTEDGCQTRRGNGGVVRHINIPIFVPHLGCPHDCAFCNQKQITTVQDAPTAARVRQTIEESLATVPPGAEVQVAFFGGSFTGISLELQRELLASVQPYLRSGHVQGIRLSTRPDYIDQPRLDLLRAYGVQAIELGVQSMNDRVLQQNQRGHTAQQVREASRLIQGAGFSLGLQMMVGLDGATVRDEEETAEELIRLHPDTVRIYPTIVLPGTELMRRYQQGTYRPMALEPCVALCARLVERFSAHGISIIRLGLQATETICETGELIGPYHSSFGELVYIRQMRDKIVALVETVPEQTVWLRVHPKDISRAVGNRRETVRYCQERYGKSLVFVQGAGQPRGQVSLYLPKKEELAHKMPHKQKESQKSKKRG